MSWKYVAPLTQFLLLNICRFSKQVPSIVLGPEWKLAHNTDWSSLFIQLLKGSRTIHYDCPRLASCLITLMLLQYTPDKVRPEKGSSVMPCPWLGTSYVTGCIGLSFNRAMEMELPVPPLLKNYDILQTVNSHTRHAYMWLPSV